MKNHCEKFNRRKKKENDKKKYENLIEENFPLRKTMKITTTTTK